MQIHGRKKNEKTQKTKTNKQINSNKHFEDENVKK